MNVDLQWPTSSVVVKRFPFGVSTFPNCTADIFDTDELTITCVEEGCDRVMAVYRPGTWREATVYGSNEYPMFSFVGTGWQRNVQPVKRTA